jgi:hypothetical protein
LIRESFSEMVVELYLEKGQKREGGMFDTDIR